MNQAIISILIIVSSLLSGCGGQYMPPPKLVVKPQTPAPVDKPAPVNTQEASSTNVPFKQRTNDKIVIVLDPGHGGEDYGTHSLGTPKYHEKYLNLSTSQMVKNFLQQFGYQVIMTRTEDTFISL